MKEEGGRVEEVRDGEDEIEGGRRKSGGVEGWRG